MSEGSIKVLMIGPRRAGKSSVLSAMLKSLTRHVERDDFRFEPDQDTRLTMEKKLTDLEKLFVLHTSHPDQPFSTIMGQEGTEQYSEFTSGAIKYVFNFYALNKYSQHNDAVSHSVEFTDISGELLRMEEESEDKGVIDRFIESNVIVIAIDAPALMEGRLREGVGEFHTFANMPDRIREVIATSDARMTEDLQEGQKIKSKLILFVPLKCEKYYHAGEMEQLKERVKLGYRDSFDYLAGKDEYTVAITPILTLGDIVFDHYDTTTDKKGREMVRRFGAEAPQGIAHMPNAMFRLRDASCRAINPLYCEQPLLYIEGYILGLDRQLEKAKKKAEKERRANTPLGKAFKVVKFVIGVAFYQVFLFYKGMELLFRDESLMKAIRKTIGNIKVEGDGYEIVQDNLGIRALKDTYSH